MSAGPRELLPTLLEVLLIAQAESLNSGDEEDEEAACAVPDDTGVTVWPGESGTERCWEMDTTKEGVMGMMREMERTPGVHSFRRQSLESEGSCDGAARERAAGQRAASDAHPARLTHAPSS